MKVPIDLKLIEETNAKALELCNIVKSQKYNEGSVIEMIRDVNDSLKRINTLPQEFCEKYEEDIHKWKYEMEEKQKPHKLFLAEMQEAINIDMDDEEDIEEKSKLLKKLLAKYGDEQRMQQMIEDAYTIDTRKFTMLLSQNLFIKLSRQRRNIRFVTDYIFKFRHILIKFTAGLISFLITTIAAKILGLAFNQYSDFVISFIVFAVSLFTLDILIGKKYDKWFWRTVRKQTFILYGQLGDYVSQTAAITQFMKSGLKTELK
jgi:hypothetical protein